MQKQPEKEFVLWLARGFPYPSKEFRCMMYYDQEFVCIDGRKFVRPPNVAPRIRDMLMVLKLYRIT
jgi:hypothetical protein